MQLLGLLTLARSHQHKVNECEELMNVIVKAEDEYGTLLTDAIYDDSKLDAILKNMGIKVTK